MLGRRTVDPLEVDSLDEVLFLARRSTLLSDPLTEDPDLAWHAYAVELGMRTRARGRRVAAVDIPLTHNSMSTNLARLDHAHAALARLYPDQVPTRTTCGDVTSAVPRSEVTLPLARHRWRLRWLRRSWAARAALAGSRRVVLADVRTDLDRVLSLTGTPQLTIRNVVHAEEHFPDPPGGTRLRRGAATVVARDITPQGLGALLPVESPTLVTNLDATDLIVLGVGAEDDVVGWHETLGYWLLTGMALDVDELWSSPQQRPWRLLRGRRAARATAPGARPWTDASSMRDDVQRDEWGDYSWTS
jgi:hypothetical protein